MSPSDDSLGWTVERIDTTPINTQQRTDVVAALATLITEWSAHRHPE